MNPASFSLVFDPLCGWCYAVHPALQALQEAFGLPMAFLPSGLFSGAGARPMSPAFRDMAWGQDQRIQQLTGQVFSEAYHRNILGNVGRPFDSTVPTLAFLALEQAAPGEAVEILHRLQRLRNVEGVDSSDPQKLLPLALAYGLDADVFLGAFEPDSAVRQEAGQRQARARELMRQMQAQGVPELVLQAEGRAVSVPRPLLYGQKAALLDWVGARL